MPRREDQETHSGIYPEINGRGETGFDETFLMFGPENELLIAERRLQEANVCWGLANAAKDPSERFS